MGGDGYTYATIFGDDRIHVYQMGVHIGWIIGGQLVSPITREQTDEMLRKALER